MSYRGIAIRDAGDRIYFVASFKDAAGALVASTGGLLYMTRIRTDGTLDTYDFNDNTFKTTAVTTETVALTHRKSNNTTVDTGIHTYMLTTITGFTVGDMILVRMYHADASPTFQEDIFQYAGSQQPLRNEAWTNFPFMMFDTSGNPATGATVTCTRSIDGGAFGAGALANVAEIANGWYKVDFGAADRNGKVIGLRATATGCRDTNIQVLIP